MLRFLVLLSDPRRGKKLGTCFEGRASSGGDQVSSRKLFGFSEEHWQSPWSQVAHETPALALWENVPCQPPCTWGKRHI